MCALIESSTRPIIIVHLHAKHIFKILKMKDSGVCKYISYRYTKAKKSNA